jgi:paraquat-inducible protein A
MTFAADLFDNLRKTDLIACADCGLVQETPSLDRGAEALCARCGATLAREHHQPITGALVWSLTALFLALPAYLEPVFKVSALGMKLTTRVDGTVSALIDDGFGPLSLPLGLFAIAIPVVWLLTIVIVLGSLEAGYRPPWLGRLFRYALTLDMWAMPDVFVMGGFVAYTRLQALTHVEIATGGWAFLAFAFTITMMRIVLDKHFIWQEIAPDPDREPPGQPLLCPHCGLLIGSDEERIICPRCAGTVMRRKPNSFARCAALVIASYLLYIPANLLPVLSVTRVGHTENDTILAGVIELLRAGMWPLALIVFTASIAVPVLKLFALSWFLVSTGRKSRHHIEGRTRLHRIVDAIGRWSNIDVFMIGLLAALVNFGNLVTIRPEPGANAFACVVFLTMLASNAFDARLMWDAAGERNVR